MDGSLILLFGYEGERLFATRGSFESEQAVWAADWFGRHAAGYLPPVGETLLMEAIYPGNRIVVDYAGKEELVALGSVDLMGSDTESWKSLPAPVRQAMFYGMADPRTIPHTDGEGFVLRWPDGTRAKVKLDEYVRLHRMIFGTSTKTIWASLRAGENPAAHPGKIPAELRAWIGDQASGLRAAHAATLAESRGYLAEAEGLGLTRVRGRILRRG